MKISDRDKILILGVLFLAITLLPIFFFIRPKNQDIDALNTELEGLNERYSYLKNLDEKRPTYEAEIERLNNERTAMVNEFAEGILQENTIMFLYDIETRFPMAMTQEDFSGEERTVVTEGRVENGQVVDDLTAVKTSTTVTFKSDYEQVKMLLDYVFNYDEKMTISATKISYKNGLYEGYFVVDEFAFVGSGRSVESVQLPSLDRGNNDNIFRRFKPETDEENNQAEGQEE